MFFLSKVTVALVHLTQMRLTSNFSTKTITFNTNSQQ